MDHENGTAPVEKPVDGGAEVTIAAIDEYARACIGQHTYYFVKRILRDPELRKLHAQKQAELEAAGYFDKCRSFATN